MRNEALRREQQPRPILNRRGLSSQESPVGPNRNYASIVIPTWSASRIQSRPVLAACLSTRHSIGEPFINLGERFVKRRSVRQVCFSQARVIADPGDCLGYLADRPIISSHSTIHS